MPILSGQLKSLAELRLVDTKFKLSVLVIVGLFLFLFVHPAYYPTLVPAILAALGSYQVTRLIETKNNNKPA
jgi:hypothetical protein